MKTGPGALLPSPDRVQQQGRLIQTPPGRCAVNKIHGYDIIGILIPIGFADGKSADIDLMIDLGLI